MTVDANDLTTVSLSKAAARARDAAAVIEQGLADHGTDAPWEDGPEGTRFVIAMRDLHRNTAILAHFFADQSRRRRT